MGIFDFFKRQRKEPKENEEVDLGEVGSWIDGRISRFEKERSVYRSFVREKVVQLSEDLRKGVVALENIDWEKIKVEERLKLIARENLGNYIFHLSNLSYQLEEAEDGEMDREKLRDLFSAFEKRSAMNYEKATLLIGKELGAVTNSVSVFFRELNKIHDENKTLFRSYDEVSNLKEMWEKIERLNAGILRANEEIDVLDRKVGKLEKVLADLRLELDSVKKEKVYLDWIARTEILVGKKDELEKKLALAREKINFKALAKVWHDNPGEMAVVKEYRESFTGAFLKDRGDVLERIVSSLDNGGEIKGILLEVKSLDREIKATKLAESPCFEIEKKINKLSGEIDSLLVLRADSVRKLDKLVSVKTKSLEDLRRGFANMGVNLICP